MVACWETENLHIFNIILTHVVFFFFVLPQKHTECIIWFYSFMICMIPNAMYCEMKFNLNTSKSLSHFSLHLPSVDNKVFTKLWNFKLKISCKSSESDGQKYFAIPVNSNWFGPNKKEYKYKFNEDNVILCRLSRSSTKAALLLTNSERRACCRKERVMKSPLYTQMTCKSGQSSK